MCDGSTDRFPATYQQEWLFDAAIDGWSEVNVPVVARLRGQCDRARLSDALAALVERHEALRTTLARNGGGVEQLVKAPRALEVEYDAVPNAHVLAAVHAEIVRPFPLQGGDLVRARVVGTGPSDAWLVVTAHHVVTDGWSRGVVFRDLVSLYGGNRGVMPAIGLQLGDFAAWERGVRDDAGVSRWARELGAFPARPVPAQADTAAPVWHGGPALSAAGVERVIKFASECGTTFAGAVLAAASASLRWLVGTRVAVGMMRGNRERRALRDAVGCFADLLPVPIDMSGDPTVAEFVSGVGMAYEEAADAGLPLGAVAPVVGNDGHGRLFDVIVNFLPRREDLVAPDEVEVAGLRFATPDLTPLRAAQPVEQWPQMSALVMFRPTFARDGALQCGVALVPWLDQATGRLIVEAFRDFLARATARPEWRMTALVSEAWR